MINLFAHIEDGIAIVRKPGGVLDQTKLYTRKGQVFIPTRGGYLRICDMFSGVYLTPNPSIKVLELKAIGLVLEGNKAPAYKIEKA